MAVVDQLQLVLRSALPARIRNPSDGRAVVTQGRGQPLAGVFAAPIAGVHSSCPGRGSVLPRIRHPLPSLPAAVASGPPEHTVLPRSCQLAARPATFPGGCSLGIAVCPQLNHSHPTREALTAFISLAADDRGCLYTDCCPATSVPPLPAAELGHGVSRCFPCPPQ